MAAVHIVHYTSGCHAALGIYGRARTHTPRTRLFVFCHFTTSRFSKLTSEPLGRKIRHHLPPVTNNIFWIMIASIGLCICKMRGNEFFSLPAMKANRDVVSPRRNGSRWMRD